MVHPRRRAASALSITSLAVLAACSQPGPPLASGTPVPDAVGPLPVVSLDQGWDEATQLGFWFTSQGARLLPYAWFLALEQADGTGLFRADANIERLGYLPARPGAGGINPDGLPVGFARAAAEGGQAWVGLTCAACHTAQINLGGLGLRIDGGPAMADFNTFYAGLVAALQATLAQPSKFDRFANRVLGNDADLAQRAALRADLAGQAQTAAARLALNMPTRPAGHARLDAFGNIFNQVLVVGLAQPANARPPDAPVSYPFLWDTPQHDKVQWNGSAPNGPFGLGEVARNVGEVLGVFGGLTVGPCGSDECKYPNHVDTVNLGRLEGWLRGLWSPQWDARWLPAIDTGRATRGQALYAALCQGCHAPIDRTDPQRQVTAVMCDVGTDPAMATASATRTALTGPLQGTLVFPTLGRYGSSAGGGALLGQAALGVLASDAEATLAALAEQWAAQDALLHAAGAAPAVRPSADLVRQALRGQAQGNAVAATGPDAAPPGCPGAAGATYKARPLNGIWATAPFLHNGSVPSLWQLLQPPASRVSSFFVGSRAFDPVDVGFETRSGPYRFDTRVPGNSNQGHAHGTQLPDAARRDLLEYLKTL